MNGLCGFLVRKGSNAAFNDFDRMATKLKEFGHAHSHIHKSNQYCICIVNNNASIQRNEIATTRRDNGWVMHSTCRLDDYKEASSALGNTHFSSSPNTTSSERDSRLLDRVLLNEPEEQWQKLCGDWVHIAWHEDSQVLRITKEPYGQHTLYYTCNSNFFAFSTYMPALLEIHALERQFEPEIIACSLMQQSYTGNRTVFDKIKFLPVATQLVLPPTGEPKLHRYWRMEDELEPLNIDYNEAKEEMQFLLNNAIRSRTRGVDKVASMLSSGLDSSSVALLCADQLLPLEKQLDTYSLKPQYPNDTVEVRDNVITDETEMAQVYASTRSNIRFKTEDSKYLSPLAGIEKTIDTLAQPFYATSNDHWFHAIAESASYDGNQVLLGGMMGNVSYSWGYVRALTFRELIRNGRIRTVGRRVLDYTRGIRIQDFKENTGSDAINPNFIEQHNLLELRTRQPSTLSPHLAKIPGLYERLIFVAPESGTSVISNAIGFRNKIDFLDPTADTSLLRFSLRVPNRTFMGPNCKSRWLARQIASWVPPENKTGWQSADLLAKFKGDRTQVSKTLDLIGKDPYAASLLNVPELESIWLEIESSRKYVDAAIFTKTYRVLMNGLATGLFAIKYKG